MALLNKLSALYQAKQHKSKVKQPIDILVVRFSRNGLLGNSRPCSTCQEWLSKTNKSFRIRYVYYSTDADTIVRERVDKIRSSPSSGYLRAKK
jgi:hypothetical protein